MVCYEGPLLIGNTHKVPVSKLSMLAQQDPPTIVGGSCNKWWVCMVSERLVLSKEQTTARFFLLNISAVIIIHLHHMNFMIEIIWLESDIFNTIEDVLYT